MRLCKTTLLLGICLLSGCDDGYIDRQSAPAALSEGNAVTGQGLYNRYCASCHGSDARGKSSIGSADIRGQTSAGINAAIGRVSLMNGLASQLDQQQIVHIAAWLQSLTPLSASLVSPSNKLLPPSGPVQITSAAHGCSARCH